MSGIRTRALAVEREASIRQLLSSTLAGASFDVETVASVEEAWQVIRRKLPEVMLIDWLLPGNSALHLAQHLKVSPRTAAIPLIMLASNDRQVSSIAKNVPDPFDIITKPFKPSELVARTRKLLKRTAPHHYGRIIEVNGVSLDSSEVTVKVDGVDCRLRPNEFRLLRLLLGQPRQVFSRNQIINLIWSDHSCVKERTVDVSIRRLRVALGSRGQELIESVHGVGYRFAGV
jgi:two-component system phosphate regulon response regulator PhoB